MHWLAKGAAALGPLALLTSTAVLAQGNLERMRNVQTTGVSYAAQFIDQTGPKAEQIIAKALKTTPKEIWPSRYQEQINCNPKSGSKAA